MLERLYLNIIEDVPEVLSIDTSIYFWQSDHYGWLLFTNEIKYWNMFRYRPCF